MDLKPIATLYNGYLFRSRLEARWAVFFDTLDIAYEYEKEGYDLGTAGWYLPDFWLPVQKCWIEIKGADPTEGDLAKVKGLALAGKVPVWLFKGPPNYHADDDAFYTDYRINAEAFFFEELPEWYPEMALSDPDEYGGIEKVQQAIAQQGIVWQYQGTPFATTGEPTALCPFICSDAAYRRAFTAARSARFEHRAAPL
jgi:hypothetical protein